MKIRNAAVLLALLVGLVGLYPGTARSDHDSAPTWQHSAKFLCGTGQEGAQAGTPDDPGRDKDPDPVVFGIYETAINVHNPNFSTVAGASNVPPNTRGPDPITQPTQSFFFSPTFRKKALILYPTRPAGRSEDPTPPENWVRPDSLPYDYGFEIDCKDIRERLITSNDERFDDTFIKGYVVIEARSQLPLDVTVAYTGFNGTGGQPSGGFSLQVETIQPKRIR